MGGIMSDFYDHLQRLKADALARIKEAEHEWKRYLIKYWYRRYSLKRRGMPVVTMEVGVCFLRDCMKDPGFTFGQWTMHNEPVIDSNIRVPCRLIIDLAEWHEERRKAREHDIAPIKVTWKGEEIPGIDRVKYTFDVEERREPVEYDQHASLPPENAGRVPISFTEEYAWKHWQACFGWSSVSQGDFDTFNTSIPIHCPPAEKGDTFNEWLARCSEIAGKAIAETMPRYKIADEGPGVLPVPQPWAKSGIWGPNELQGEYIGEPLPEPLEPCAECGAEPFYQGCGGGAIFDPNLQVNHDCPKKTGAPVIWFSVESWNTAQREKRDNDEITRSQLVAETVDDWIQQGVVGPLNCELFKTAPFDAGPGMVVTKEHLIWLRDELLRRGATFGEPTKAERRAKREAAEKIKGLSIGSVSHDDGPMMTRTEGEFLGTPVETLECKQCGASAVGSDCSLWAAAHRCEERGGVYEDWTSKPGCYVCKGNVEFCLNCD
jgi:hypothetical protein